MSSSLSTLEIIQAQLVRYFPIFLLVFGTFGNVLNICIFTRPKLRSVPCSWYFLASTCTSLIALYMGCLTRVLNTFNYYPRTDLGTTTYCKLRTYLTYASLSVSVWLIIGACADRWASSATNVRIRSWSNVKKAKRIIIGLITIVYLVNSTMLYCFSGTFESDTSDCQAISDACDIYSEIALIFTYSLFPASLMLIFGLLTIRNIHHSRQQISLPSTAISSTGNTRRTTRQMTVMLLAQVICSLLLSLPISIEKIYVVFNGYQQRSNEQVILRNFLGLIVVLITLTNSSISFYIFTLTGKVFRQELKQIFRFKLSVSIAPLAVSIITQNNTRR